MEPNYKMDEKGEESNNQSPFNNDDEKLKDIN